MNFRRFSPGPAGAAAGVLGTALATGAVATAEPGDPIQDAWPYGTLPFTTDIGGLAGSPSDVSHYFFDQGTEQDVTFTHADDDAPWYTAHQNILDIPSVFSETRTEVTDVLDDSAAAPHVGTVSDHVAGFYVSLSPVVTQPVALWHNDSLYDPELGYAAHWSFGSVGNLFLSDSAGVKDVVDFFGERFTLFEFPAADLDTGAAGGLDDGFDQLLAELTAGAAGA